MVLIDRVQPGKRVQRNDVELRFGSFGLSPVQLMSVFCKEFAILAEFLLTRGANIGVRSFEFPEEMEMEFDVWDIFAAFKGPRLRPETVRHWSSRFGRFRSLDSGSFIRVKINDESPDVGCMNRNLLFNHRLSFNGFFFSCRLLQGKSASRSEAQKSVIGGTDSCKNS